MVANGPSAMNEDIFCGWGGLARVLAAAPPRRLWLSFARAFGQLVAHIGSYKVHQSTSSCGIVMLRTSVPAAFAPATHARAARRHCVAAAPACRLRSKLGHKAALRTLFQGPEQSRPFTRVCAAVEAAPVTESERNGAVAPVVWRQAWWCGPGFGVSHPLSHAPRVPHRPVAFTSDLDASKPSNFKLLGEQLVLWHDGAAWRAFADRCPHRLAPLSEGRITEDGLLECPYHGWAFSHAGACEVVPQDAGGAVKTSPRACATAYETRVAQGMLFVCMEKAGDTPLPTIPELDDPSYVYIDVCRDLPYDYTTLLENVLDVSHVPYTHHATVSNRANGGPVELEVLSPGVTAGGFDGLWQEGPRRGKLGPQTTKFVAPSLMYHSLVAPSLGTTLTVVYGTPSSPGRVRLLARFPFKFNSAIPRFVISKTPRWLQHQGQNGVLEDDVVFLAGALAHTHMWHTSQRARMLTTRYRIPRLPVQEMELAAAEAAGKTFGQACFMPLRQDAYVLAFRQWLSKYTQGGSPWRAGALLSAAATPQTKEALLDRYNSHTVNCVSCMAALRGVRLARALSVAAGVLSSMALTAAVVVAAIAPASAFASPLAPAVTLLLSVIAFFKLGGIERGFITGPYPPKRNLISASGRNKNTKTKIKLV